MLDQRFVTENLDDVRAGLARRGYDDEATLSRLTEAAATRREVIVEVEALRQTRNEVSKAMGQIADKKSDEFAQTRTEMKEVGEQIKALEARQDAAEAALREILESLPNLPHESSPDGLDETGNVEILIHGKKPDLGFEPKDHVALGTALDIIDFERGAKISGSRFAVLKGAGARLERALMAFMLDLHSTEHGYTEIWPPVLVKDTALRGTGQLPKFEEDLFKIASAEGWQQHQDDKDGGHDLYLAPTAEVQVTNLHSDEILDGKDLPVAYTAYSACFRAEAGSYGKDTKGLIRQHQFDKVELVRFCRPEDGEAQLDLLRGHAEQVLQRLGLHYRVVQLCAGDMGFSAHKAFDLEVWLPAQDTFREISSCSWFGDFQARRAKIRYRPVAPGGGKKPKPRLVHTLNGSALAIGRTLVAILEQYQQADGSIVVPEALRSYMGGLERIAAT
ncbi:MAG: serine--tRNA ligase [Deltaproteobacteria bacterium]|nr:MAG: serine--tRNA ligase [Deltaproteobacteria bacterium]